MKATVRQGLSVNQESARLQTTECQRTQSIDTSLEAEQVQFNLWRKMTPGQKEALFKRVAKRGATLALMGIKRWALSLNLTELLAQALKEAGLGSLGS